MSLNVIVLEMVLVWLLEIIVLEVVLVAYIKPENILVTDDVLKVVVSPLNLIVYLLDVRSLNLMVYPLNGILYTPSHVIVYPVNVIV